MKVLNCHLKGGDIAFMAGEVKPWRLSFEKLFLISTVRGKAMSALIEKGKTN